MRRGFVQDDHLRHVAVFEQSHGEIVHPERDGLGVDAQERLASDVDPVVDRALRHADLDETVPLEDGENAAVRLANGIEATQFYCDEFNRLVLVHASLTTARLVTTPVLLAVLVRGDVISSTDVETLLDDISEERSWSGNAYVARAREALRRS